MSSAFGERELQVEIGFECPFQLAQVRRSGAAMTQSISLQTANASVQKPVSGMMSVPQGISVLCINYRGAMVTRPSGSSRVVLVAPRSLTFVRPGTRVAIQAARGEHEALLISWPVAIAPGLESWVNAKVAGKSGTGRPVSCRPVEPHFVSLLSRIEAARAGPEELLEPLLLGAIHEAVAMLCAGPNEMALATVPSGLPPTIQDLILETRANSSLSWPLKDAAEKAGYSPFHFSRVFKQLVGYGFHEYVDRCRTEAAVEMLVTSDTAVDLIASACGFGTTQGLRESVKEYLGLVPSELRNLPDGIMRG
jgi:AraC-like DNA-binding protein